MAAEEDNFDIDIYGDGGEDYQQENSEIPKADHTPEPGPQGAEAPHNPAGDSHAFHPRINGFDGQQDLGPEDSHARKSDVAQKIASTDDSSYDPLQLPKQAPQTQGLKRKEGSDDRYTDPAATTALFISDLHWWVNDDDIRGWANQNQCEDELEDVTFNEHKVNGKSKGQAYVLFKSPQAATATKEKIESFGDGQQYSKRFTVTYANPFINPFRTLPKDGPARNNNSNMNRSGSGFGASTSLPGQQTGYSSYRGGRGGGYNNRGNMNGMSNYNRGGFQQPISGGFQGAPMGGFQGMGGMQSYGGFQNRGGMLGNMRGSSTGTRGGRGGMGANGMMGMPMGGMMGGMAGMGMGMPQMGAGMGMQGSLTLITSVLGASATWIVVRHIWAALKSESSTSIKKESEFRIVFISWLRGLDFWKDAARKLGLNLTEDARTTFVDALQSGLGLQRGGIGELEKLVLNAIKETTSINTKVLLVLDGIDFLLAATDLRVDEVLSTIWALREVRTSMPYRSIYLKLYPQNVETTIISVTADFPLMQENNTSLELHHAAFVLSIAHQARAIWAVKELDTGSAKDVSGILRITRGPAFEEEEDMQRFEVEEKELLYYAAGDGGVKVFERGSS
ncbi:MAG: hypothetical protein Q9196_001518 [Gyalolechia fulgens]